MSYKLRRAYAQDAQDVAQLIYSAYKEYAQQICGSLDLEVILDRLKILFAHPKITIVHYSHYSILIDEADQGAKDKIIGVVSCLRGDYIPMYYLNLGEVLAQISPAGDKRVNESIYDFVHTRVAYNNEYHLDVLAVDKDYQGKKLAEVLLDEAVSRAKKTELPYLTLLSTDMLKDFYLKKGFLYHRQVTDFENYNILYKKMDGAPEHYKDYQKI